MNSTLFAFNFVCIMRIHPGKRSNYKLEDVEDAAAVLVMISGARTLRL
jgi:hypothetical protein